MEKRYIVVISFLFLFLVSVFLVYAATARIPSDGDTNWGADLRAFLEAGHNDAGVNDAYVALSVTDAAIADGITVSKLGDTAGVTDILVGTAALTGGAIAAGARQDVAVTMTGLDATNDVVWCKLADGGDFDQVYIMSTEVGVNTATVRVGNPTTASITVEGTDGIACVAFKRP